MSGAASHGLPGGFVIQKAVSEDIDELEVLEMRCFPEEPWTRGMLAEELANKEAFFAVVREEAEAGCQGRKGRITGYICAWLIPPYECQIGSIAVLPEYRRRGIAAALIRALLKNCSEVQIDDIYLEVRVSNTPAIELYRSFGFKISSIRRKYYQDGEDAYNMARLGEDVPEEDRE